MYANYRRSLIFGLLKKKKLCIRSHIKIRRQENEKGKLHLYYLILVLVMRPKFGCLYVLLQKQANLVIKLGIIIYLN